MNRESKNRNEIEAAAKWNIEAMYPEEAAWEKDIEEALAMGESFREFRGHLMDSAESLCRALDLHAALMRKAEHAFVYTRMRHDEDNAHPGYTAMNSKAMSMLAQVSAATSFFTPELLEADPEKIAAYRKEEPALAPYAFMLDQILRSRDHVLSSAEENILATLSETLNAPDEIYTMLNNADLRFGTVNDENGDPIELTHGNYTKLMESENRAVREAVFTRLYETYREFNNTIAVMYHYSVKHDVIRAKLRRYGSALEAALSSERIPLSVYSSLVDAVHESLPSMHKYMALRKKALGIDELKMHDVYRPLVKPTGLTYTYEEAVDLACRALAPLGEEYVATLRRGLSTDRWVDIYENRGKTSGAYSFGSYDSAPYILMNFSGELRDVFTLVHEGGHSMHSHYTRKTQPYIYGSHSIFTAEVASTVNETLLIHYLLEHVESDEMKLYLINFYLDEFKSTLFRQTMFAEFEKIAHETVEAGGALTAELLNERYDELNSAYFGPALAHDDLIRYEWSRIPHFYRAYYVYQYATGYSAANAIANAILGGGAAERDAYLEFLSTGDSADPIDLLRIAGVDMSTEAPVRSALSTFRALVDQLETLLS